MNIVERKLSEITPYENNPRRNDEAVPLVANSIQEFGFKQPIVVDKDGVIVAGHTRYLAAKKLKLKTVPVLVADDLTDEQIKAYRLADNKVAEKAEWDFALLDTELDGILDIDMEDFGFLDFDDEEIDTGWVKRTDNAGIVAKRFIVPPFTVLDTRKGYWQQRKKDWYDQIGDFAETRGNAQTFGAKLAKNLGLRGISLLDPVMSEVMTKWFCIDNGNTFDCFAGDTVFGYVSASLGCKFTGTELRKEQADFNNSRVDEAGLDAHYYCDDGRNIEKYLKPKSQDMLFSCPPYFDLEKYSDLENDASNQKTYGDFIKILDEAFTAAGRCLKDNRFAVIVVGDIRNHKDGSYYNFPRDICGIFQRNGFILYNEFILVENVGSRAITVTKAMETRKAGKVHQNVLVFYKGDPTKIKENFKKIEYEEEDIEFDSEDE